MPDSGGFESGTGWREYLFAPRAAGAPESGRGAGNVLYNPYVLLAFRLILAGVFIYAGLQKIGKPLMFADEIRMYGILDRGPLLYTTAIVLPWVEILCGISIVTGIFLRGSALLLLLLNAWFLVIVWIRTAGIMNAEGIAFSKIYFDCGCGFGVTYAWKKLIEDAFFFIFSCALFLAPAYRFVLVPIRRKR
ncbi:MAG TPA: DoxX family protein [Patescibacteria group bacterium]|nr:DoxX family protein [Patescibacteria group bacterium]